MPVRNEDCQGQDLAVQWALGHLLSLIGIKNVLHNVPLQGRQGSRGCIPNSPGESGLVSREAHKSFLSFGFFPSKSFS